MKRQPGDESPGTSPDTTSNLAPASGSERSEAPSLISPELKALAQIAGGLAPALNDLLTDITGRASQLLDAAGTNGPTREAVSQICTAGEKAGSLIRQLLLFSGWEELQAALERVCPRVGPSAASPIAAASP